jgi:EmrB/QacA subfamily drug resistance transporter
VPVGILGVLAARVFIDESKDTSHEQRVDLPGLVSSGVGLFALTYGLIETNSHAWGSTRVLSLLAVAAVALALFVLLELRQRLPMLDLSLFRDPSFSGANVTMALLGLAMFGVFFYTSLFLQNILGYSAVKAGATFLPMTVLIMLVAPIAGRMTDRIGPRWLMGAGMSLLAGALLLFATLDQHSSFWNILPGLLIGGVGMAITMAPTTSAAMSAVPIDKAGVGSAVINSMRQVGGSLGVAIMGTLIAGSISVGAANPGFAAQFVHGYHRALFVGAALLAAGAIIAVLTVGKRHREPEASAGPAMAAS